MWILYWSKAIDAVEDSAAQLNFIKLHEGTELKFIHLLQTVDGQQRALQSEGQAHVCDRTVVMTPTTPVDQFKARIYTILEWIRNWQLSSQQQQSDKK